jgi:hypothetical protein
VCMNFMQAPTKQYVLPFVMESENRREPFGSDAEAAAIYALSELERKSGIMNKRSGEKIAFITKIGYPLWLIPRGETTYVFDGLNKSSYNWQYYETTNMEFALENLEVASKLRETYLKFLEEAQNNFEQTLTRKELSCSGLIANTDFLGELGLYRREATEIITQSLNVALLSTAIEEIKVNLIVDEIENIQNSFREKTEKLKQLSQLINKTTIQYITGLQFEADAVKDEAEAKIKAQEEVINPKIASLTKEYQAKIKNIEKNIKKEQLPLQKQKSRLEKTIKVFESKIEQYNKNARIQSNKHNSYSESNWKKKAKWSKKEASELQKQQEKTTKQLKALDEFKTNETIRLRTELQEKIKHERQPIYNLESIRNANLLVFRQEIQKLEKQNKNVSEKLVTLIKQRESIMARTGPLGVKSDPKMKKPAVLYVPFYLTCYNSGMNKRYLIFPPSMLGSIGFSAKFKGALGRTKIGDLLNSRFKSISGLTEKIRLNAAGSSEFETEIEKLAQKNNVINSNVSHVDLKKGLFSLKVEGWLSETEYQGFLKTT